ncbi:PTS system mannose/fructose/N-acetylgalactosamine-transporter subunit IIB [Anaerococcus marasmi]|uniref:PTS system mannose/fructose/N-acetylgalactosamine-transporter subunit IIB n=1 Tax=Anaerococcus marasmi TaxID=2057797 RepID=UPI000CFA7510|nr:PTS sugar transporter subunit IIB [Anaerococcus marasmi]
MAEIIFTRIDDRLLHGQVGREWVKSEDCDLIVVANDEASEDRQAQKLMNIATPLFAETVFWTIDRTIKEIEETHEDSKALILVESPEDAYKLVDAGLNIDTVNVGNMRELPNKDKINENIYVGDKDREYFKKLHDKNISIDIRTLHSDKALDESVLF